MVASALVVPVNLTGAVVEVTSHVPSLSASVAPVIVTRPDWVESWKRKVVVSAESASWPSETKSAKSTSNAVRGRIVSANGSAVGPVALGDMVRVMVLVSVRAVVSVMVSSTTW